MTKRWVYVSRFVLFAAIGLLLSSCLTVEAESDLEEDGSGFHSYRATIDKAAMAEFGEMADPAETEADFDEAAEAAREQGYEVEEIDTEEHIGLRLSRDYDDSQDVGTILNDLFSVGAEEAVSAFSGSFTQDGDTHTLEVTVSGEQLAGGEMTEEEGISPAMLSGFITMTYTVRMPGEIDEDATNGRILEDGRVQWDLPLTGSETFTAVSETEGEGASTLLLLGVIALLFVFIGGAALLALFLYLRSRRTQPATAYDPDVPTAPYPHAADPNKPPAENY